jgi:hypothetical protein
MRFLCDVHISYKIANHLNSLGFETLHVNEILVCCILVFRSFEKGKKLAVKMSNYIASIKKKQYLNSVFGEEVVSCV